MDRTKFFQKVYNTELSVEELDFLWSNFDKFTVSYLPGQIRLTASDIMRPDLLSYKAYGTVDYWWILCFYNSCLNPLVDMNTGDLWKIPNIADIYVFIKKYKVRQ
jgi:hypothetical protein